jgi:hypothetical protein
MQHDVRIATDIVVTIISFHSCNWPPPLPPPLVKEGWWPTIEVPVNVKWPPGTPFHSLSKTVLSHGEQIMLDGHDCGFVIFHWPVWVCSLDVILQTCFSGRQVVASASSKLVEGSPVAAATLMPMVSCGDPIPFPLVFIFNTNNHKVDVSGMDVLKGVGMLVAGEVAGAVAGKLLGKLMGGLKKFASGSKIGKFLKKLSDKADDFTQRIKSKIMKSSVLEGRFSRMANEIGDRTLREARQNITTRSEGRITNQLIDDTYVTSRFTRETMPNTRKVLDESLDEASEAARTRAQRAARDMTDESDRFSRQLRDLEGQEDLAARQAREAGDNLERGRGELRDLSAQKTAKEGEIATAARAERRTGTDNVEMLERRQEEAFEEFDARREFAGDIDRVGRQQSEAAGRVRTVTAEHDRMAREVQELRQQKMTRARDTLEQKRSQLTQRQSQLSDTVGSRRTQLAEQERLARRQAGEADTLTREIETRQTRAAEFDRQYEALKARQAELRKQRGRFSTASSAEQEARRAKQQARAERNRIQGEITEMQRQATAARTAASTAESNASRLRREADSAADELRRVDDELTDATRRLDTGDIEVQSRSLRRKEADLAEMAARKRAAETRLQELNDEAAEALRRRDAARTDYDRRVRESRARNVEYARQLDEGVADIRRLEAEKVDLERRIAAKEGDVGELARRKTELEGELADTRQRIADARTANAANQKRIQDELRDDANARLREIRERARRNADDADEFWRNKTGESTSAPARRAQEARDAAEAAARRSPGPAKESIGERIKRGAREWHERTVWDSYLVKFQREAEDVLGKGGPFTNPRLVRELEDELMPLWQKRMKDVSDEAMQRALRKSGDRLDDVAIRRAREQAEEQAVAELTQLLEKRLEVAIKQRIQKSIEQTAWDAAKNVLIIKMIAGLKMGAKAGFKTIKKQYVNPKVKEWQGKHDYSQDPVREFDAPEPAPPEPDAAGDTGGTRQPAAADPRGSAYAGSFVPDRATSVMTPGAANSFADWTLFRDPPPPPPPAGASAQSDGARAQYRSTIPNQLGDRTFRRDFELAFRNSTTVVDEPPFGDGQMIQASPQALGAVAASYGGGLGGMVPAGPSGTAL